MESFLRYKLRNDLRMWVLNLVKIFFEIRGKYMVAKVTFA